MMPRITIRYVRVDGHDYSISTYNGGEVRQARTYYRRLPDDPQLPWMLWEEVSPGTDKRRRLDEAPDCFLRRR